MAKAVATVIDTVERNLSDILKAATVEANKQTAANVNPDVYGRTGVGVKSNIAQYGNTTADTMEKLGSQALTEAETFNNWCKEAAAIVREEARKHAEQAEAYVNRMSNLMKVLNAEASAKEPAQEEQKVSIEQMKTDNWVALPKNQDAKTGE